ncbi:MAG: hypothetical protein ABH843_03550 [Candidatus Omnitrophota bacterium]
MVKIKLIIIAVLFLSIINPGEVGAMRFPPKDVEPVIYNGVRYTAPHWPYQHGGKQNGGYIEAWDADGGQKLWNLKVYTVEYDTSMETDVQDIFITSLNIENGKLIIVNEREDIYEVDIITKKVTKTGGRK